MAKKKRSFLQRIYFLSYQYSWLIFLIWALTVTIFFFLVFLVDFEGYEETDTITYLLLGDVLVGVVAYLVVGLTSLVGLFERSLRNRSAGLLSGMILGLMVFVAGLYLIASNQPVSVASEKFESTNNNNSVSSSEVGSIQPTTIPTIKQVQNQQYIQPTIDPDPIIICQYQYLPDQQMRSSQCKSSIECRVGDNWYLYPNQQSCNEAQEKYINDFADQLRADRLRYQQYLSDQWNTGYQYQPGWSDDIVNEARNYQIGDVDPMNPNINVDMNIGGDLGGDEDCIPKSGQQIGSFTLGGEVKFCD